jgi:hypothetical protein
MPPQRAWRDETVSPVTEDRLHESVYDMPQRRVLKCVKCAQGCCAVRAWPETAMDAVTIAGTAAVAACAYQSMAGGCLQQQRQGRQRDSDYGGFWPYTDC